MKNKVSKIIITVTLSIVFIVLFTVLCVYTYQCYDQYKQDWIKHAFWWPWVGALFIMDLVSALVVFNSKNRTDENKSFWLFIILILPFFGFFIFVGFGRDKNCKNGTHPNSALLLENIFQAQESIVVCAKVFFPPYDIFESLSFAANSNKKITIIVSKQEKKYMQELMHHRFERQLSRKINIYFTDQEIFDTFMIIDNKKVIVSNHNFNYKNVFSDKPIVISENVDKYKKIFDIYMQTGVLDKCEIVKRPPYKRAILALANIFYIIL